MVKEKFAIGVDVGGTKIDIALVDSKGIVHEKVRTATDVKNGSKAIEQQIIESILLVCSKHPKKKPITIGIGVPGQIDANTGDVKFAPNLGWKNVSLLSSIETSIGLKGNIINDVKAATWGEWKFGAGKNCNDIVCIFVGTGVGGGIISDGKMLNGHNNASGEIGHITINYKGDKCKCGNIGCLETLAGGLSIAERARKILIDEPYRSPVLLELAAKKTELITTGHISYAAQQGDEFSNKIFEDVSDALIAGCVSMVNCFNPSLIVLGGGVIEGYPEMVTKVEKGIKTYALLSSCGTVQVTKSALHENSGVIGAATFALNNLTK